MTNLLYKVNDIIGTPAIPSGYVQPSDASARIAGFFSLFLTFVTIASAFFLIKGGLDYVMSGGDANKVKTGMLSIQYAIMGLIVAGVAFVILGVFRNILGLNNVDLNL